MANYLAIAAVAKTVLKLVEDHCPRDEFAATPKFTLVSGHDFGATPVAEGFTLLVWRVSVNSAVRNQPARRTPDGRKRRPALPVDLGFEDRRGPGIVADQHNIAAPHAVGADSLPALAGVCLGDPTLQNSQHQRLLRQAGITRGRTALGPVAQLQ